MQPLILLDRHVRSEQVGETDGGGRDAKLRRMACCFARRSFEEEVKPQDCEPARVQGDEPGEVDRKERVHREQLVRAVS